MPTRQQQLPMTSYINKEVPMEVSPNSAPQNSTPLRDPNRFEKKLRRTIAQDGHLDTKKLIQTSPNSHFYNPTKLTAPLLQTCLNTHRMNSSRLSRFPINKQSPAAKFTDFVLIPPDY